MARTAIISDIHGELDRLRAVLADAAAKGCTRVLCLGDTVDGGPDDNGSVAELMRLGIPSVRGNCDGMGHGLGERERAWLNALPERMVEGDVVYTHISPRVPARRLADLEEAGRAFSEMTQRVAFIGHIHVPFVCAESAPGRAVDVAFEYEQPMTLEADRRYIVCVGAVGRGRDGIEAPRYAVFDAATSTLEMQWVRPGR